LPEGGKNSFSAQERKNGVLAQVNQLKPNKNEATVKIGEISSGKSLKE